jgi:hypothetical protein
MDAIWLLSGATYIEGREFMFRDLPAQNGPLAGHWEDRNDHRGLGAQRGRLFDHGRAFNFYTANLERKFGPDWRVRWREETVAPRSLGVQHDRQLERPRIMGNASSPLHGAAHTGGRVREGQLG